MMQMTHRRTQVFQWAKVFEHGVSVWQSLFDVGGIFEVLFPDESKNHVRICS